MLVSSSQQSPELNAKMAVANGQTAGTPGAEPGMQEALHGQYSEASGGLAGGLGSVLKGVPTEGKPAVLAEAAHGGNGALSPQLQCTAQQGAPASLGEMAHRSIHGGPQPALAGIAHGGEHVQRQAFEGHSMLAQTAPREAVMRSAAHGPAQAGVREPTYAESRMDPQVAGGNDVPDWSERADHMMGDANKLLAQSKAQSAASSNAVANLKTEVSLDEMPEIQMLKDVDAAAQAQATEMVGDAGAAGAAGGTGGATAPGVQGTTEASAAEAAPKPAEPAEPPRPMAARPSGVPGDPGTIPRPDDKPPADSKMSVDDYKKCNNGVLEKMGNQEGMMGNLKGRYGDWDDTSRSKEDREASAFNAARHLGSIKNKLNGEGEVRSEKVTQNGKMEGCTKDGDIRDDTEMADLKNSLKPTQWEKKDGKWVWRDLTPEQKAEQQKNTDDVLGKKELRDGHDPHVKGDGTNMDNAEYVGHKILEGLSKVLDAIRTVIDNTIGKIPGIGKILTAPFDMVTGAVSGGLKVADAAVTNSNPKKAAQNLAHDVLSTASGALDQLGKLANDTIGKIPGVGKIVTFVEGLTTKSMSEGLNIADAAAQGEKGEALRERAKDMGKNVGARAVGNLVSMVDQSGVVADMAEKGVQDATGAKSTAVDPEAIRAKAKAEGTA